ncbi:OmpA family protein [Bombella sp. ESL0385]|uniref:OmpA family protein n=1 Tax=Bombella sp. ESL0385 TaxID=2676446 RepID=UPI0012D9F755|nr:OmpA family protein [Bombella sp. ESL0385]MUG90201.1 OmpA family protein [Bombella sp. ESL0385]
MRKISAFIRQLAPMGTASLLAVTVLAGCASHPPRNDYVVFFDTESVKPSATGVAIIANAVKDARKRHISQFTVSGSAGKMGDDDVLKKLAEARADKVIALLQADGVNPTDIHKVPFTPSSLEDSRVAFRRVTIHLGKN